MRLVELYSEALPRLQAGRTLDLAWAAALGGGNVKDPGREFARLQAIAGGGEQVGERLSGLGAFALLRAANDRARAKGELWEQRVERANAEVVERANAEVTA